MVDDHHRPRDVHRVLRGGDRQSPAGGHGPPHRGGGDGPRRDRVDDVPQGHAADDRARAWRAAALLAAAISVDDYVVTSFNAGQTQTFPLFIFGATRQGVPAEVNVLATMLLLVVLVLMALNVVLQRARAKRDFRATGGAPGEDRPRAGRGQRARLGRRPDRLAHHARRRHHQARAPGGPPGPGAARPAAARPGPGPRSTSRAAGVNFADTMARVGLYPDAPTPPCGRRLRGRRHGRRGRRGRRRRSRSATA